MPSPLAESFGPTVRRVRLAHGLSQSDVSRAARLKHGHLSAIEHGRIVPRLDTLVRLAQALGVTPPVLLEEALRPDHARRE